MATKDKTFSAFTAEQAAQYASGRGMSYPAQLYQAILDYHDGKRELLLDVGTGPGKVVFDLAPLFEYGIGTDPGVQMIEYAKKDAHDRGVAEKTRFAVSSGEECAGVLSESEAHNVDVLTVAMAAHWMDMPTFYAAAGKALRSGGTLAMWTCSSLFVHPSMRNAKAIQEALSDLEDRMLKPYYSPSSYLTKQAYDTLPLPWSAEQPDPTFEKSSFRRIDWDRDGVPSAPPSADGTPGPFLTQTEETLKVLEKALGTASPVINWRKANPEKAHTEDDPVAITVTRLKRLCGVDEKLIIAPSTHLLLMRKA